MVGKRELPLGPNEEKCFLRQLLRVKNIR